MTLLSILVCTTIDRRPLFQKLYNELDRQAEGLPVEILFEEDNKQISVGAKRQKLLLRAKGEYIVYFDSDDFPYSFYVSEIMKALESKPDCVGFEINMTTNGIKPQVCCHSLRYPEWKERVDGYDYVRNVTQFNPIRRELVFKVGGYSDMRYGEDKFVADKVTRLCKTEVFIQKRMFHYRYSNKMPHKQKYGIK